MSECDLVELARVSKVQRDGFVVCTRFQKDSMRLCIHSVSSNVSDAPFATHSIRHDPRLFIGKCVPDCFSESAAAAMSALLERHLCQKFAQCSFACDVPGVRTNYLVSLIRTSDGLVFEILLNDNDNDPLTKFCVQSLTNVFPQLETYAGTAKLFEGAITMVSDRIDYDRAVVYQFQDDMSGRVVHERIKPSLRGKVDSFLNMCFPASDIPLPARQMLMLRSVRVVFDSHDEPFDMVGKTNNEDVDLSRCILRANHPVHATYMKNMGVRSSVTIAIVVKSDLWGLMCFHAHNQPLRPRGRDIGFFESVSTFLSSGVTAIRNERYSKRETELSSIIDRGFCADDIFSFLVDNAADFLRVMGADCLSIRQADRTHSRGDANLVVTADSMERLSRGALDKDWAFSELGRPLRGVLCIVHADLVVVFVRESKYDDKVWAGDPSHVKIMRPDGVPGPRGSFERYIQSGADCRNKWTAQDRQLATYMSSRIKLLLETAHFYTQKTRANELPVSGQVIYTTTSSLKKRIDPAVLSHLSHDLKTPIHGLSSAITLILEDPSMSRSDTREHLTYSLKCVKQISTTVNNVLSIAGGGDGDVHVGDKQPKLEKLCLQTFVDGLVRQYCKFDVTAQTTVDKSQSDIVIDASKLYNTLCAIIENSVTYSSSSSMPSSVRLSVSCYCTHREAVMAWQNETDGYLHRNIRNSEHTSGTSDSDLWYTFSVYDCGCGIHGDMLDNVLAFNDETRSATSISKSHQGVSVDIYRCISNVFDMNGSLAIASTVSKGTVTSIMLPAQVVAKKKEAGLGENLGVFFVVDDNTVNRKLACRLVTVAFTKTVGVAPVIKSYSDGRLCVEEIQRMRNNDEKILGILMDHHMPVMSGMEATAKIRETECNTGLSKIPIFGFTADSTESTREELLKCGMDDVLPKPLSMDLLEETCVRILDRKHCLQL